MKNEVLYTRGRSEINTGQTVNEQKYRVDTCLSGLEISYLKIQLKFSNPVNGNGGGRVMKM